MNDNRNQWGWVRIKNEPIPLDGVSDCTRLLRRTSPSDALDGMSCLDSAPAYSGAGEHPRLLSCLALPILRFPAGNAECSLKGATVVDRRSPPRPLRPPVCTAPHHLIASPCSYRGGMGTAASRSVRESWLWELVQTSPDARTSDQQWRLCAAPDARSAARRPRGSRWDDRP